MKNILIPVILILFFVILLVVIFLKHPKFGKRPVGERLRIIQQSPNYRDGAFQNLNPTPQLAEDASFFKMFREFFSSKNKRPPAMIPSKKTNLHQLLPTENVLVWFGHSSYFIQVDGKKIIVDPVFSGSASPFSFMMKAFDGTDVYTTEDIPDIDYLIITHDHWDHLDYKTVREIKDKVGTVFTGLGTGAHLESWGYNPAKIIEMDWYEKAALEEGFSVVTTPARHFSGRGLKAKQALWVSFVLQTPSFRLFIGGDGGYDTHFAEIGKRFGPFDLAILENGQYNKSWKYIHMMPEQVLQAAKDLGAKKLLPVHNSKFALANHPWDEPMRKITRFNIDAGIPLLTPVIGEKVYLQDSSRFFEKWWENVK